MEHEVTRCDRCVMSRDSRVKHLLKECTETDWWRRKNGIYEDTDIIDVLKMEEAIRKDRGVGEVWLLSLIHI